MASNEDVTGEVALVLAVAAMGEPDMKLGRPVGVPGVWPAVDWNMNEGEEW